MLQFVHALCLLAQILPGVAQLQAPGEGGQLLPVRAQVLLQVARAACLQGRQLGEPFVLVGAGELGGGRGCRCTLVGYEIGDGEVDFVAHSADDRYRAGMDGAGHRFLVERPQVFQRAAAAGQDEDIAVLAFASAAQHGGDFAPGILALDRHRIDQHRDGRETAV